MEFVRKSYTRHPALCVPGASCLVGLVWAFGFGLLSVLEEIFSGGLLLREMGNVFAWAFAGAGLGLFLVYPAALTIQNICQLVNPHLTEENVRAGRYVDLLTILWGAVCVCCYLSIADIRFADWNETLINSEVHSPIATWTLPTLIVIGAVGAAGYVILRYVPLEKLPPLLCVLAFAAMYLGAGLSLLFTIQLWKQEPVLSIYPLNLLLVTAKTVRHICFQHEKAKRFTGLAFLVMWPLLGIIVAFMILFGQKPNSIIAAWTQTSDWTFSLKEAPPNVQVDMHYLCTVAAGGHPAVVKPLRMGERHGHRIVVNRQLLVANAFEDLLSERLPGIHRRIRHFYDTYGYPIARHIKNRWTADAVYILMKPLEYFFVVVLYLFDAKPENRIAVQYMGSGRDM